MYKTILIHVDADDPGIADRLRCAAALAADHGARLIGVAAAVPLAAIEALAAGGTALAGGMITGDPGELEERFAKARSEFTRWTEKSGIETEWRTATNFPAIALSDMATATDLIVIGGGHSTHYGDGYVMVDAGDLIMSAGRPVLTLPAGVSDLRQARAVVAWKNTREARRALADSLGLLRKAPSVTLFHIKEDGENGLSDANAFLRQHGIAVTTVAAGREAGDAGEQIIRFAVQSQAHIIVAGAYGHTRLREWAFGGVTRTLMHRAPVACLFGR